MRTFVKYALEPSTDAKKVVPSVEDSTALRISRNDGHLLVSTPAIFPDRKSL